MTIERPTPTIVLDHAIRAEPLGDERLRQVQPVEHACDSVVHDVVDIFWMGIEGGHRRPDPPSPLRERGPPPEGPPVQPGLPPGQGPRPAPPGTHRPPSRAGAVRVT